MSRNESDHRWPAARRTAAAVGGTVLRMRTWAAPHVENAGKFLQHSAAPKVSAMLTSAARRLEPAKARSPRRTANGAIAGAAALAAAASAAVAAARGHRKQDNGGPASEETPTSASPPS